MAVLRQLLDSVDATAMRPEQEQQVETSQVTTRSEEV